MHPIRLSTLLILFFLLGPGSVEGLALLLVQAGFTGLLPNVGGQLHGVLQLGGVFTLLIWGFLAHGFPGMLGVPHERTHRITGPITAFSVLLLGIWWGTVRGWPAGWIQVLWGGGFLAVLAGSSIFLSALRHATRSWLERPVLIVIVGLVLMPVAWFLVWLGAVGYVPYHAGVRLFVYGCILPIILAMGCRMFAPMLGLQEPRPRLFDVACTIWYAGAVITVVSTGGAWGGLGNGLLLMGAVVFTVSLRIFEVRRRKGRERYLDPVDTAYLAYVRAAFAFLLLGEGIKTVSALWSGMPGLSFFWLNLGFHYVTLGFGLLIVMGVTQRIFPVFMRGIRSSAPWMWMNLALLVAGLLLRLGHPFLPAGASWVQWSGVLTYMGIVGFGLHLLRGTLFASKEMPRGMERIRNRIRTEAPGTQS
jgi:hypothetical protein